jgi:three-Cys-motif partner protein
MCCMGQMKSLPAASDDGLVIPEIGPWGEDKYRLIALYDELFSKGMKDKWDKRVYIDLYAGSGYGRVKGRDTVLMGSPLLALSVDHPFDRYIFCEQNPQCLAALRERVKRVAPSADVVFIEGSCDDRIDEIRKAIPAHSRFSTVLSLCLVDPFDFGLKFSTIRQLSDLLVDFLVLLAAQMDANRNYENYVVRTNTKIDEALGSSQWRERWEEAKLPRERFPVFLAEEFAQSMTTLGYLPTKAHDMKRIKTYENNMALYYLALFSKNKTAYKFWNEGMKYATDQRKFWD